MPVGAPVSAVHDEILVEAENSEEIRARLMDIFNRTVQDIRVPTDSLFVPITADVSGSMGSWRTGLTNPCGEIPLSMTPQPCVIEPPPPPRQLTIYEILFDDEDEG